MNTFELPDARGLTDAYGMIWLELTAAVLRIGPQELQRRRAKAEKALHEAENLRLQCQGQSALKIISLQLTVFAPVLETWLSGVLACRTLESQYQTQYYPHHAS